jgi:nitrite transporter NirC
LAGAYLGFGIVLIISVGSPLTGTQFAPFMKLIMGVSISGALSLVIFTGSELFTGKNMVFAIRKLKNLADTGHTIKLFIFCIVENLLSVNYSGLANCARWKSFSRGRSFDRQDVGDENVVWC